MTIDAEIKQLLTEIRDDQREILQRRAEHLDLARRQLEQARRQIDESTNLQREALARAKNVGRIAVPGIVVCIAATVYLVVRYL